jgi:hypothetical protein
MVFVQRHHEIVELPPQKEYYSMENRILHLAEHTRRLAQVLRWIGPRYTAGTPSPSVFGNYWGFIVQLSSWEWYHYMQNQILHATQYTKRTAEVVRRIGTRYTAGTPSVNRFLGTIEVLSFSYPAEKGTIGCKIKFCMQHNTLEEQHKSSGESGQDILLDLPQ